MSQLTFDFTTASILLDSSEPFPVDFDRAWEWLGFSRRDNAKASLFDCGFIEKNDFLIVKGSDNHAGLSPKEKGVLSKKEAIWLTIDCFKTWGMMTRSEQGKQVRNYFLECEKVAKAKINTATVESFRLIAQQNQRIDLLHSELQETIDTMNHNAKAASQIHDLAHDTSRLVDRLLERNTYLQSELDRLEHPYGNYYVVLGWLNIRARGINDIKQLSPSQIARIGKRCAAECEKRGIAVEQVHDMRYVTIGAYPATIIQNCIPAEFYI
jgi:phage anti-repressor protein